MTRSDFLRKRILPIIFIVGIAALVQNTCMKNQRIHATIVIGTGEAEPKVKSIEAKVMVEGELVGELRREAAAGMRIGKARFEVSLPEADGQLIIDVDLGGEKRQVTRRIHATEGATIDVDLSSDLR